MKPIGHILSEREISATVETTTPCFQCGSTKRGYNLRVVPTNRPDLPLFPKYNVMIKENCLKCSKYIRFSPQTPELVELINKRLEGLVITT